MTRKALMTGFDFDDADMVANRLEELTDAQRLRLKAKEHDRLSTWWSIYTILGAITATLIVVVLWQGGNVRDWSIIAALLIPMFVGLAMLRAGSMWLEQRAIRRGRVRSVTGKASVRVQEYVMTLTVGRKMFHLSPSQAKLINDGQHYTVHYLPFYDTILSIAPDGEATPDGDYSVDVLDPMDLADHAARRLRLTDDGELQPADGEAACVERQRPVERMDRR
jgi:hypothetical protein